MSCCQICSEVVFAARYECNQSFSSTLVRYRGHNTGGAKRERLQNFLDLAMRDHFPCNFAEAGLAIHDLNKPIRVHYRNVSGNVPPVP